MYCARLLNFCTLHAKPGTAHVVKLNSRYFSKCRTTFCEKQSLPYSVKAEESLTALNYDGIVYVSSAEGGSERHPDNVRTALQRLTKIDAAAETTVAVLEVELPAARLVYSPTGNLNPDYDDVRSYEDAAEKGIRRALEAGIKEPLLLLPQAEKSVQLVTLLGALKALYVPLQLREDVPSRSTKVKNIGVVGSSSVSEIIKNAVAIESGRWAVRDIGGGDPERMAPPQVEEYVRKLFKGNPQISVKTVSDQNVLCQEYPLFAAVNRAASDKGEVADVLQSNNEPSSSTPRGHQFPAAFLLRVSGLDKNGIGSPKPMKYTHVDITSSCGSLPDEPTGCPVVGFTSYFLLPHVN